MQKSDTLKKWGGGYKQDEAFYEQFSKRIDKIIEDLRTAKKEDVASLFNDMKNVQEQVVNYDSSDIPDPIRSVRVRSQVNVLKVKGKN